MLKPGTRRWIEGARQLLLAGAMGFLLCGPLAAQCAMCRESAAYQRQEAINALERGILVLAIPPTAIVVGIACLTYRYRGAPRERDDRLPPAE
jgi:hypothetical protein